MLVLNFCFAAKICPCGEQQKQFSYAVSMYDVVIPRYSFSNRG